MKTMKPLRKNRLGLVFQDCGGAGKTDLAKNIADWYAARNYAVKILDAEIAQKGAGMTRSYFPNAAHLDITTSKQFDDAMSLAHKEGTVLCDVGANAGAILKSWLLETAAEEMDNHDTDITLFISITSPEPTAISLFDWSKDIPPGLFSFVVAKNEKDGATFETYDHTVAGKAFQAKYDPYHIRIPKRDATFETQLVARRLTMLQAVALFQAGELELIGSVLSNSMTIGRIQRNHQFVMNELDGVAHLLRP